MTPFITQPLRSCAGRGGGRARAGSITHCPAAPGKRCRRCAPRGTGQWSRTCCGGTLGSGRCRHRSGARESPARWRPFPLRLAAPAQQSERRCGPRCGAGGPRGLGVWSWRYAWKEPGKSDGGVSDSECMQGRAETKRRGKRSHLCACCGVAAPGHDARGRRQIWSAVRQS